MIKRGPIARAPFISQSRRIRDVGELPLDKFGINNGYIRSFCKDCNNKYHREYRHSFLHR